ncbi:MAG: sugar phosphate isomerase/epimerase family protein [Armatimonadota bacterium]
MKLQNYEQLNQNIRQAFITLKREQPEKLKSRLNLSWSNWGFGVEDLAVSGKRLSRYGVTFIELHGNRYGQDLGYKTAEVKSILSSHGISVSGICGMFSADNDLSSNVGSVRQKAIDYIRRNIDLGHDLGASYFLIVPGAVGRPQAIDDMEFQRSVETLQLVADVFVESGIRGAVEPIRSAEVSFCHTVEDAIAYIEAVGHPGVQHINGDVYHMQAEESHIGSAVVTSGERLTNIHLADSNRCALGEGSLDVDTLIMALYLAGANNERSFATPEPLGPGGDPYPAMFGRTDGTILDALVQKTAVCFREREDQVRDLQ